MNSRTNGCAIPHSCTIRSLWRATRPSHLRPMRRVCVATRTALWRSGASTRLTSLIWRLATRPSRRWRSTSKVRADNSPVERPTRSALQPCGDTCLQVSESRNRWQTFTARPVRCSTRRPSATVSTQSSGSMAQAASGQPTSQLPEPAKGAERDGVSGHAKADNDAGSNRRHVREMAKRLPTVDV